MPADLIYGGVEGGATNTFVYIVSADGEVLASVQGGATNHYVVGKDVVNQRIIDLVQSAKDFAGLDRSAPLTTLGLSLSGMDTPKEEERLARELKELDANLASVYYVCNDAVGSLATATDKGGVVLIAGTGSICFFVDENGRKFRAGGWGHAIGDEGSAYYIAQQGIQAVFRTLDGYYEAAGADGNCTVAHDPAWLSNQIMEYFKLDDRSDILSFLYTNFDKAHIAGLCKVIAEGAEQGDRLCKDVFFRAGKHLGGMARVFVKKMSENMLQTGASIVCVGSVWKSFDLLKDGFLAGTLGPCKDFHGADQSPLGKFRLVRLKEKAALGAAALGAHAAGEKIPLDYANLVEPLFSYP